MKTTLILAAAFLGLVLASCQNPVTNVTTVTSSGTLPLGKGHAVYVATGDGYGVLVYANGASNWTRFNWSALYPTDYSTSRNLQFPPVFDVTTVGSTIYAATEDGLLVGSGSTWNRYLAGIKVNGVAISGPQVYVSTNSGLKTAPTSSLAPFVDLGVVDKSGGVVVLQWILAGSTAYAATPSGLFSTTTPTTASYVSGTLVLTKYPLAGYINALHYASASGILYVGTPLGYSTFDGTWTDVVASSSAGFSGPVNGILAGSSKVYLATSAGFSYGSGSSWTTVATSRPVRNVVQGADTKTLYAANGYTGLLIIPTDSSGVPLDSSYWNSVLAGLDVSKVYVTVP